MVGPILHQEMLLGSRRNRLYIFRWIYAGWLVLQVFFFYVQYKGQEFQTNLRRNIWGDDRTPIQTSAPEIVGAWFAEAFVKQQLILLALAIPAFVAGAITDEKRRGTLQYLLLADVGTRQIILGKLLGRVAQVVLLALAGLPLFGLLAGFGGVEPLTILVVGVAFIVPTFALASATLLASVWCRQTRDAVLALYVVGVAGWLLVTFVGGPLSYFDPLYVLAPAWGAVQGMDFHEVGLRLLGSVVCWGLLGGACLGVAVWRLRPVYVKELESSGPRKTRWYSVERVPVDDEPVLWRERHVEGLAPNPSLRRIPQWLGITGVAVLTVISSTLILSFSLPAGTTFASLFRSALRFDLANVVKNLPDASEGFLAQSIVVMLLASLVVGIRCSGSVTGERERQTWEALLLTPLTAKQVIRGKMWGVMGASYWYLLAYAAPAVVLSVFGGLLALFWVLVWLAVTVLAMYFIGATALWCSVRSKNSWRALLSTLCFGYLGGAVIYLMTSPAIILIAVLIFIVLQIVDWVLQTQTFTAVGVGMFRYLTHFFVASCIGLALIFWLMARLFLTWAQRWIADRERTRHWNEEPIYRRSRRRAVAVPREVDWEPR
jgi:ABC-type transport system involved in multi-copper enzyme maturation permease subunit